jgi:hypothetical protein
MKERRGGYCDDNLSLRGRHREQCCWPASCTAGATMAFQGKVAAVLTHPAFAPRTEKMAGRISAGRVVQLGWLLGALADAFSPAPLVVAPVAARLRFAACSQRVSLRHQLTLAAQQPLWDSVSVSVPASASDLPGTSIRRKIWVTDNPGNLNNLHQVPPSPAQGRKARPRRGTLTPGVRACAATRKRKRCRPRGPAR